MTGAVGIIGGGAWGTALAIAAARAGRQVTLWARDRETVAAINDLPPYNVLPKDVVSMSR